MTDLDPQIEKSLREAHEALAKQGALMAPEKLREGYAVFRERFGPDVLRSLDGVSLLNLMHLHGNKESLVYWLEFKNDDEFPGRRFGSIAGGSSHKFGLFRRRETGQWVTGSGQNETVVSEDEAVEVARKHRDQLLEGVALLENLPENADDETYGQLQRDMVDKAPDVSKGGWGHKYFHLIYPDKLDDFHLEDWQRMLLIRLLQTPPAEEGLYACAGRYVRLSQEFGWPMNHLTTVLYQVFGGNRRPRKYWRIGTRLGMGRDAQDIWPEMARDGYVAIGWDAIGDLSQSGTGADLRAAVRDSLSEHFYPADAKTASRKAGEVCRFVEKIAEGDVVLAKDGEKLRGVGIVTGPYFFEQDEVSGAPHRRLVEWRALDDLRLPKPGEGNMTTVKELTSQENWLAIERALLGNSNPVLPPTKDTPRPHARLDGIPGRVQAILERKGQVILYGPPGTGKTYWGRSAARDVAAMGAFRRPYGSLSKEEQAEVDGTPQKPGLVRTCTFHPAYGYEDFIEGFRPLTTEAGQLSFQQREGVFKRICRDAGNVSGRLFVLLIDEINRGDIPRIFGELLTLLEMDKRGMELSLPISGEVFSVPPNVRVIGTMNTADRSIALLDTALRRRFGFIELLPNTRIFRDAMVGDEIPLGPWLEALNERIRDHMGRDGRNLQVGHAYLLNAGKPVTDFQKFVRILAEDIIPLLQEYCYEDFSMLAKLLGPELVDESAQRIREALFAPEQRATLVQSLLALSPDIGTSADAKPSSEGSEESDDDSDEE